MVEVTNTNSLELNYSYRAPPVLKITLQAGTLVLMSLKHR